jgi:hypothetical protein
MDASNHPWKFVLVFGVIIEHRPIPNRGGVEREYLDLVQLRCNLGSAFYWN